MENNKAFEDKLAGLADNNRTEEKILENGKPLEEKVIDSNKGLKEELFVIR